MGSRWPVCLVVVVAACAKPALPSGRAAGPANDRLPALHLVRVSTTIATSPAGLYGSGFVIAPDGGIVVTDGRGDGYLYTVLDSAGAEVRRIGREGDGPGEVRGDQLLGATDSTVVVGARNRIVRFGLDGGARTTAVLRTELFGRAAVSDTEALGQVFDGSVFVPALVSIASGSIRTLVPANDSFLAVAFPPGIPPDGHPRVGVVGLRDNGFVVGDGWNYRLGYYDWTGHLVNLLSRTIPRVQLTPARVDRELRNTLVSLRSFRGRQPGDSLHLRDDIASTPQEYFPHTGHLGLDGQGRVWVVGIAGDSGFADLFNQRRFIGRLALPCDGFEGAWSINGAWLAVACAPDDPDFAGEAVFKVFRLVD